LYCGIAICLAASACTSAMRVPDALEPGAGAALAMVVPAKGVQIYECRVKKEDPAAYEWAFVAPDAELFDSRGNVIGRHGAGPYWEAADGSRVTGKVMARADAPAPGAIPWLLLSTTNAGPRGAFSEVTRIQRVNTAGGAAPSKPCTAGMLGQQAGTQYVADYRFFTQLSNR
jgi:hypothetical protein